MRGGSTGKVLETVGRLFGAGSITGMETDELLERFAREGDEAAFEGLVRRFGPMVLAVCRRGIGDEHTAEDAFQATFLVLASKAGSIRDARNLAPWVYGVARKVSARARTDLARRRARERGGEALEAHEPTERIAAEGFMGEELDREVARLPRAYREVVIACDLEGLTHEEAARRLGWPVGTVKGRLHRARGKLRDRLEAKGAGSWTASLPALLAREARRPLSETLVQSTVGAAKVIAAGGAMAATGAVPGAVLALSEGVVSAMFWSKLKPVAAAVVVMAVVAGGGVLAAQQQGGGEAGDEHAEAVAQAAGNRAVAHRLARDKLEVARKQYEQLLSGYLDRLGSLKEDEGKFQDWERRWKEALAEPQLATRDRAASLRAHRDWIDQYANRLIEEGRAQIRRSAEGQGIGRTSRAFPGTLEIPTTRVKLTERQEASLVALMIANEPRFELIRYFRLEVQTRLAEAGSLAPEEEKPGPAETQRVDPGLRQAMTDKTKAILAALDRLLKLDLLPQPTVNQPGFRATVSSMPHDLSQIREATRLEDLPEGLPIILDPFLLTNAGQSWYSGFDRSIPLDDIPLGVALKWLLWSKGLDFAVHDDLVHVSTRTRLHQAGSVPGYGVASLDPDESAKNRLEKVQRALDRPLEPMSPDGSSISLDQALERLRKATEGPELPGGLPILTVESILVGTNRFMTISLQVPTPNQTVSAREALETMLRPHGLRYGIAEGLVVIGPTTDDAMPPIEPMRGE